MPRVGHIIGIPSLFTRSFCFLIAAHFLQALGYASMLLLPSYLAHLGASRTEIGTLMATAAVGSVTSRAFVAYGLDKLGRKRTLVAGTLLLVTSMVSFALVDAITPLVFGLRFFMGAGIGALWTGYFTFASDLIPAARRTEGLALFGLSGLIPLVLNPFASESGISGAALRWLFPSVGVLTLLSLVPLAWVREVERRAVVDGFKLRTVLTALKAPQLRSTWFAITMLGGGISMFMAFATVTAESRQVTRPAALWFTYALGAAIVRLGGGRLPDRVGTSRLVPPALLAFGAAAAIIAYAESDLGFLVAGLVAGTAHGIGFPVLTSQAVSRTPEHLRGTAVSTLTALWELSGLAMAPAFGRVSDVYSDRAMFLTAAGVTVTSVLIWWGLERRSKAPRASQVS